MIQLKKISLIGILFIVIFSCRDEEVKPEEVSSDLIISVDEIYPGNKVAEPVLVLKINTEELYPCANYELVTQQFSLDGNLKIEVTGASIGDICLTAFGQASTTMNLHEDVKLITLEQNGMTDEFTISITKDSVTLDRMAGDFSSFENTQYHRYPENSFAFICRAPSDDTSICDDFITILQDSIKLDEFTFPPDGKIPYSDSSSLGAQKTLPKFFKYQQPEDFSRAGQILNLYFSSISAESPAIDLRIIAWNNREYANDQEVN